MCIRTSKVLIIFAFVLLGLLVLSVVGLRFTRKASATVKLKINASEPQGYRIAVSSMGPTSYEFNNQGEASFDIPPVCVGSINILGIEYVWPGQKPTIEIIKGEAVIKRLSSDELFALAENDSGYLHLNLEGD